jgi:hypothetical protein
MQMQSKSKHVHTPEGAIFWIVTLNTNRINKRKLAIRRPPLNANAAITHVIKFNDLNPPYAFQSPQSGFSLCVVAASTTTNTNLIAITAVVASWNIYSNNKL